MTVCGIFRGATVVRGPDWDWGNQDGNTRLPKTKPTTKQTSNGFQFILMTGGPDKKGLVLDIRGWDNESERSVVNVAWQTGITNVYRLGHKGKVDLKCTEPAANGSYYRTHLPVLGMLKYCSTYLIVCTQDAHFKIAGCYVLRWR